MQDAHSAAMRIILAKRRTEKEVSDLLIKKGFSEDEAVEAAAYYKNAGYIDDRDYARRYAIDAARLGGKGPLRIRHELSERGVLEQYIDEAIDGVQFDIISMMEKKFGKGRLTDLKQKNKIINFFIYRGFEFGEIKNAMDKLFGDDSYE